MSVKRGLLALCLCLSLLLCACTGASVPVKDEGAQPAITLPPIADDFSPPVGDAQLGYVKDATLYLKHQDGTHLIAVTQKVSFSAAKRKAESLIRALLAFEGEGVARPLGGEVRLQLYGANPVEVSRDVATVNLSASALQLSRKDYYIACQAIANTLTELDAIHYVNVQVVDKQLGLDTASVLATGSFQRSVGTDVGAGYEQLVTQRVETGESEEGKRLSALVTLYFPLTGGDGVMCESRSMTFSNQKISDMAYELLTQLELGSHQIKNATAMTGLTGLLMEAPIIGDMRDTGGRVVTLRFSPQLDQQLAQWGISRASFMASTCYTLTTFLPNITGVVVFIGEELVDGVRLDRAYGNAFTADAMLFDAGLGLRQQFYAFLLDTCTLYFIDAQNPSRLVRTHRPVPYHQSQNPRYLMLQLMRGPTSSDTVKGNALLQGAGLKDAELMGFALDGDTLLVNLSDRFKALGEGMTTGSERLLAYALTNTLCQNGTAIKVRYYQSGKVPQSMTGEISWAGDFFPTQSLVTP